MPELNDLMYDYRLGYVRADCSIPGFDVLGEDNAPGGKIVTLGGYTTPEQALSHSTWADSLYEQLNGNVQIINGCTDGYTSAQELIMLIRDVILLKPRLVICLSGFYNFAYKSGFVKDKEDAEILKTHPFANPGQLAFYRKFTSRFGLGNNKVYYGEKNKLPAWQYWIEQVDIIHCLCEEFGIQHMTFLQPCIFSGKYQYSQREAEALDEYYGITMTELAEFAAAIREEYAKAVDAAKERTYIADISTLFDGESNVYIDSCHVRDTYTGKIAEAIRKYVGVETNSL